VCCVQLCGDDDGRRARMLVVVRLQTIDRCKTQDLTSRNGKSVIGISLNDY
jgi:hypothetical protein